MTASRSRGEVTAALPWLGAVLVWFAVIVPLRAEPARRLAEQSVVRRERMSADKASRDVQALLSRVRRALGAACLGSSDPAALRGRAIAATRGLPLSPVALSVTGGPEGGAAIEADGTRTALLEFLRRLGDPGRGGFLRSASLRDKGGRYGISATMAPIDGFPSGLATPRPDCTAAPDPEPLDRAPEPPATPRQTAAPATVAPRSTPVEPAAPSPEAAPSLTPAPFSVVAFLKSGGTSRVSLRIGNEVRVVSVGAMVEGWKCVSIDRDEGAVFEGAGGRRLVLRAGQ